MKLAEEDNEKESFIKNIKLSENENNIIINSIINDSFYSVININPENKSFNYENDIVTEEINLRDIPYICYAKENKKKMKKNVSNNNSRDTYNKDNKLNDKKQNFEINNNNTEKKNNYENTTFNKYSNEGLYPLVIINFWRW